MRYLFQVSGSAISQGPLPCSVWSTPVAFLTDAGLIGGPGRYLWRRSFLLG